MGYYAVIILVGAFLIGGIVILGMQRDTGDADLDLAAYQYEFLAREAAQTGLNMTVRKLADSYQMGSWTAGTYFNNVSYKTGSFTTTVTLVPQGDTVDVVARGFSGPGQHVIFARYARDKDDKGIPPAFKHALVSDLYMQYQGDMLISSVDATRNASTHTNDDLQINGNSFRVEGFGTYSDPNTNIKANYYDNFDPPYDYNGDDPNVHLAPEVEIPTIMTDKLRSAAQAGQGLYIDASSLAINGGSESAPLVLDFTDPSSSTWTTIKGQGGVSYSCSNCGTPEKPAILFVEGSLDLANRIEVIGNAVVFATGLVTVATGGSGGFYGQLNAKQETTVFLGTLQDIQIGKSGGHACMGLGPPELGNSDNKNERQTNSHCLSGNNGGDGYTHGATLYAAGDITMRGTPMIVGGVVAKNASMDNGGSPAIIYASANEGTIDAGFEYIVPIGPILIAYSEF